MGKQRSTAQIFKRQTPETQKERQKQKKKTYFPGLRMLEKSPIHARIWSAVGGGQRSVSGEGVSLYIHRLASRSCELENARKTNFSPAMMTPFCSWIRTRVRRSGVLLSEIRQPSSSQNVTRRKRWRCTRYCRRTRLSNSSSGGCGMIRVGVILTPARPAFELGSFDACVEHR